jgi:hypothetical protein
MRGACKALSEVEATRGVVDFDAFASETSKYCSSIGLVAFVGCGVQVALSACLISSRSGSADTEKVWGVRYAMDGSLPGYQLLLAMMRNRVWSWCVGWVWSTDNDSSMILEDQHSEPCASDDEVHRDHTPECVSASVCRTIEAA